MLETYTITEGHTISLPEIQQDISKVIGDVCSLHELGRLVKYALPWAKKVKTTVDVNGLKKRAHIYKDFGTSVCAFELIAWDDLKTYVPPDGFGKWSKWSLSQLTENFVEWVSVSLVDKYNGQKIIREVKIFNDFKFELYVRSTKVTNLPVKNILINKKYYLDNVFMLINNLSMCKGFAVKTRKNTTNRSGETIGTTFDWESGETKEMRHRAISCALILNSHEIMCKSCSSIKVNSFYKTLKHDDNENLPVCSSLNKRESYMTPDEIKEKLVQEKKRRKIADRRQHQHKKVISEMQTMDKDDSADVQHIFDSVKLEELDDDMVLFWEAQRQALLAKDSRGNRWHPK